MKIIDPNSINPDSVNLRLCVSNQVLGEEQCCYSMDPTLYNNNIKCIIQSEGFEIIKTCIWYVIKIVHKLYKAIVYILKNQNFRKYSVMLFLCTTMQFSKYFDMQYIFFIFVVFQITRQRKENQGQNPNVFILSSVHFCTTLLLDPHLGSTCHLEIF